MRTIPRDRVPRLYRFSKGLQRRLDAAAVHLRGFRVYGDRETTLADIIEAALGAELDSIEARFNRGHPFPPAGRPRPGRPANLGKGDDGARENDLGKSGRIQKARKLP